MDNLDTTPQNVVKLRPAAPANVTKALSDDEALAWLRERGKITIAAAELARQWGWGERKAQRKLSDWKTDGLIKRNGKQIIVLGTAVLPKPDMSVSAKPDTKSDTPEISVLLPENWSRIAAPGGATIPHGRHHGSYAAAMVLALAALTLGGIQLAIDGQYAGGFGRSPIEVMLQAVQGVAIGLAAMMLPSVAAVLRRAGHGAWSRMAWLIWPGFLVLTILAGMGFSAGGLSDTLAGRAASIEQAHGAREQRAQAIATAQRAADTATEARKAECAPRGPRCRDREADERTALAALNTAIAAPLPLAPTIASTDPGGDAAAANLTWLSGGMVHATAADIERTWITGRAILPALAGLLLSMAVMTWPRPR